MWNRFNVVSLPPNNWLVSLKDDTVFSTLPVDGILDIQWWQRLISLCEREHTLFGPLHSLHLCHHYFSILELIAWTVSWPTTRYLLPSTGQVTLSALLFGSSSRASSRVLLLFEHWLMMQRSLYVVLIPETPSKCFFPKLPVPKSNLAPCRLLTNQRNHLPLSQFLPLLYTTSLLITDACLWVPSSGRFPLITVFQGHPRVDCGSVAVNFF